VRPRAPSDIEPRFVFGACGKRGAAGGRLFCYAALRADPTRLCKYQREIADAISDPEIERITMTKAFRVAPPAHRGKACYQQLTDGRGALPDCREVESPLPGNLETGGNDRGNHYQDRQ
jgi:hypothetical protein